MTMRKRASATVAFAVAFGLAFVAATARAQPVTLTEDEVVRRARQSYPMVAAARLDGDAAGGDLQAAEGAFDFGLRTRGSLIPLGGYPQGRVDVVAEVPTTLWGSTLFAGYRWGSDTVADYDGKLVTNDLGEVRVGAAVPTWRNGPIDRRRANIERAELGVSVGERGVQQSQLEAARAAALRYWLWVGASLRRDQVETLAIRAQKRAEDVEERVGRGDLPGIDRADAQRSLTVRRQQIVAAERMFQQAAIELSLFLRRADGTPDLPDPARAPRSMPPLRALPPDAPTSARIALVRRPDLARLELAKKQQEVEARWAGNQLAPAVDLAAVGSQDLGEGSSKRDPFELELSLMIDVPLDTDAAQGRRRAARASAARIEVARSLVVDQALAELRDARAAVTAAAQRESLSGEEKSLADALLEAERDRLTLGESTVFMVDLREQAALEAAIRQIDAAIEARRAVVVWRAAAADLL